VRSISSTRFLAAIFFVVTFADASAISDQWTTLSAQPRTAAQAEQLLRTMAAEHQLAALSVAVVDNGALAFNCTIGRVGPDRTAADGTTVFRAASLSKPVFAYLALKLVDEGLIDLDRPLVEYLTKPIDAYPAYRDLEGDPRAGRISLRLALSHQTGLINRRHMRSDRRLVFLSDPAAGFRYSGEGYEFAQFVIETLTGRTIASLAADKVFGPLGMINSSFLWEPRFEGRFAVDLDTGIRRFVEQSRTRASVAGSLITNARDYGRFLAAVAAGEGLSRSVREAMLGPEVRITSRSLFSPLGSDDGTFGRMGFAWTLGWGRYKSPGGAAIFHVGREEGCENYVWLNLDHRKGLVAFSQSPLASTFSARLVRDLVGGDEAPLVWLEYSRSLSSGWRIFVLLSLIIILPLAGIILWRLRASRARRCCG
jgi:CubicO group peptidase (beta-lactamase class C family)